MSWLMGSPGLDPGFTRSVFAPHYSKEGGHCFDPASLFFLELAGWVDLYSDRAAFCKDLGQQESGRRYRELASLMGSIPDEVDLCNFRYRVGSQAIDSILAKFVLFFQEFGLIKGELLTTDGYLLPSYSRFKGCALDRVQGRLYFCKGCRELPLSEAHRQSLPWTRSRELCRQLEDGAKRLQIPGSSPGQALCPFPNVVQKVLEATTKKGKPRLPQVALLEVKYLPPTRSKGSDHPWLAELLGLSADKLPPLRVRWCHLQKGPQGELLACCPKVPTDLEGKVGYHVDNKNPEKKELVFGYDHMRTTDRNEALDLELPVAHSTYPANANEGNCFPEHRSKSLPWTRSRVSLPRLPERVEGLDGAYDQTSIYQEMRRTQGIPIIAYNPRNENLSPEALLERGYDKNGTPLDRGPGQALCPLWAVVPL